MPWFGFCSGKHVATLTALAFVVVVSGQAPSASQSLDDRAALSAELKELHRAFKDDQAVKLAKQAVTLAEQRLGPDHPDFAASIDTLAETYRLNWRLDDAERLFRRSLELRERVLGSSHPDVAVSLRNLALISWEHEDKKLDAERYYLRSLSINEAALGPNHVTVAALLSELASLYGNLGRFSEARPLRERVLGIHDAAPGSNEVVLATALGDLASLYGILKRYDEAEPLQKRAHDIYERALGRAHPNVATSLNNLAELYRAQKRFAEAEPLYKAALTIYETALGRHQTVTTTLSNLAELYEGQDLHREAATILAKIQEIREEDQKRKGVRELLVTRSLEDLSLPQQDRGLFAAAESIYRTYLALRKHEMLARGNSLSNRREGGREIFLKFARIVWDLKKYGSDDSKLNETFRTVQWAFGSDAADSLALMAARGANGNATLTALVRERQDLSAEQGKEEEGVKREPSRSRGRLDSIAQRIKEIDTRLDTEFPEYASLTNPQPLSIADVQALLGKDEALVLFIVTSELESRKEETFVWVITQTAAQWVRSDLGKEALTLEVSALRCGLDSAVWEDETGVARCRDLVKTAPQRDRFDSVISETLPFDAARAHALYKALFGGMEDLIRDKHLLIVPSGPLTQLPFQVLVTAPSKDTDYKSTAWLARTHALTVLPAVSSLKALRRVARPSAATKPMIGFGNPLLDGNPERPWEVQWAAVARAKACKSLPLQQVAGATHRSRGVLMVARRDGHADLADVRSLMPLPDTADELCGVANDLKLSPDDIWLGARATETAIKRLSAEGKLAAYHVVHLATHGTLAGEISGSSEPGLIFTPPKEATDLDDGYLSASEVAALKLDADWVILSACNTAAGGAQGAEALSGLARAFFYAGARALLVSHWSVDSAATVRLITSAVGATARDETVGRAQALRRAMLAMIDKGEAREAHPAFWAPFVLVGEGASAN